MIDVPQRILMGPGPSDVPARVLEALARPTIGHLDPVFLKIMDELRGRLQQVFRTRNAMTLAMSGTGSAGMETAFANMVEPGDKVLICINGVFGNRMKDVAERCGAVVETIEVPWGRVFDPREIVAAARRGASASGRHRACGDLDWRSSAAGSTGRRSPRDRCPAPGGLRDEPGRGLRWRWTRGGIDIAYSGTQKCLSCPPGLSPVTLSERAVRRLDARKQKVQSWYLDLTMIRQYWGQERFYHHTAPINMLYGLSEALAIVLEEGLENRWRRHRGNA